MSDLISRSELINEIKGIYLHVSGVRSGKGILSKCMDSYKELVIKTIKEQPTAFDTEKVVAQLEGLSNAEADCYYARSNDVIDREDAIDIVNQGRRCGMRKIKVSVGTNRVGSTVTREFEVDDNATEEEIDEEAWECACDMIDYGWEEV